MSGSRRARTWRVRAAAVVLAATTAGFGSIGTGSAAPRGDAPGQAQAVSGIRSEATSGERSRVATAEAGPQRTRLGGASRYETAAAIVTWRARSAMPAGPVLRLVSGTRPLDAVAYGHDAAPMLYVPPSGAVPEEVGAAYRLVAPTRVEVIGTEAQLPTRQVRAVVGSKRFVRITDADPSRVSWRAATAASWQGSDDEWRTMPPVAFTSARVLAEAAIAVQARAWFSVVVPRSGPLPKGAPVDPDPWLTEAAVVGGTSALSASRRATLMSKQPPARAVPKLTFTDIAGRDRYDTAMDVAHLAFPSGARTAYLVNGVSGVDAAATVSLVDGPVLLVPPCGTAPSAVVTLLNKLQPHRIVTIGDRGAVCDDMLRAPGFAPMVQEEKRAIDVAVTTSGACVLAEGGDVDCWNLELEDPLIRPLRGPLTWSSVLRGATRLERGVGYEMCAFTGEGALMCWDASHATEDQKPQLRLVFRAADGIVDYQATRYGACGLGRDGRVWCHGGRGTPTVRAELGRATQIAVSGVASCLLRAEGTVWCSTVDVGPTDRPTLLPVGGAVAQISMTDQGLLLRRTDGRVELVANEDLRQLRGVTSEVFTGATQLFDDTDGCLLDASARVACPLETAAVSQQYGELGGADPLVVVRSTWADHARVGCAVRKDGSVRCRSDSEPGTWGALGDGLWAPRYASAEVLGFGSLRVHTAESAR